MNDQECTEAYGRLLEILNQTKLGWIAAQVEEQVRLGKTVEKEIETLKEGRREFDMFTVDEVPSSFKKGPKATFPVTVDYQPAERLELLLDAIEQAVVNTADMEHDFLEFFSGELDNWSGINFVSEDPNGTSISIDRRTASSRLDNAKRLKVLLHNLRSEVKR